MGKKKEASQWTTTHLRILEKVIEDDPDLYLDEIQYVFWELGQGYNIGVEFIVSIHNIQYTTMYITVHPFWM